MDPITIGLGVASVAGQLFGAAKGGKANEANEALLKKRKEEDDAFFKTRINRDFLQTNAAKGVLERIKKQYQNADKSIAGRSAITGASDESIVAQRTANNENLNDAVSSIAEGATDYQENAENQYRQAKNSTLEAEMSINNKKAENAASLASNAGSLLGTAATMGGFSSGSGVAGAIGRTQSQTNDLNKIAKSGLKGIKNEIIARNTRTPLV